MPSPDLPAPPGQPLLPTLRLLGPPHWRRPGGSICPLGPERRHQLLALLGYEAHWVERDRLAALFWPERPDRAGRANLRKVIHDLRALQVPGLEEGPQGLRWQPSSDVHQFRQAWDECQWHRAADVGAGALMQGLDGLLGGTAFGDWLRLERQRWQAQWRNAALQAAARSDDARQAWALAEQMLAVDAADEEAMAVALRAGAALQRPELAQPLWRRHVERLQAEQGIAPSSALQALQARAWGAAAPGIAPLSPLVGRARELAELAALLAGGRLVTVLGPGGIGKTRLVRHAADAAALRFAQGVVFVALDDARTPQELPARIAAALGVDVGSAADPVQALAYTLAPKSLLLVLDGFEAVIDAGPAVLRLLAGAPGLRIVVTSRERLAVDGEWLLPLAGLAAPAHGAPAEAVLRSQAVALFNARAHAVNPAFDAAAALAPVAEICRRLDGHPLALELAASWIRLLPAAEIANELARGIDFLGQGSDVDLHAVLERSWGLLTAAERDAQARLAVFRSGFTREAARQVAGVELATLAALVDKSMLSPRPDGRFEMHALLLFHARQKLAVRPDAASVHEAHSRWFLALSQQPGAALTAEHDNLLAAWQQAITRRDAAALEAVLFVLPWSSIVRGQIDQAVALTRDAAAAFASDEVVAAQLLAQQAWLLLWQERRPQAVALAQQALATLRAAGDSAGVVMALRTLGHAARLDGQHALAAQHLADGLDQARRARLPAVQALMQDGLAMALNMLGRHEAARAAVEAAMALNRDDGDTVQRVYNLYNMAQSHSLAADPIQALPWAERALLMAQRSAHTYFLPHVHVELAHIHQVLQHFDQARRQLLLARPLAIDHHDFSVLAAAHEASARLALAEGDPARARVDIAAAARLCLEHDNVGTGAALVLTAARAQGLDRQARRWLHELLALPVVQEPVRRQALQALGLQADAHAPHGLPPTPSTLRALLAQVVAAG